MANTNKPSGFTPTQYLNGAPWNGQARLYSIAAAYATALAIGDPVISSGTSDVNGVPGIVLGAVTGALRGVIVGIGTAEGLIANPAGLDITYRPAAAQTKDWYAMVVDDPNVLFSIQEASGATQIAATEIGLNTQAVAGANSGFVSGWNLASVTGFTPVVTATIQLRLMGLVRKQDNAFGAFAKHLVKINVHELGSGTGALGV
jgi:hypothetical protein